MPGKMQLGSSMASCRVMMPWISAAPRPLEGAEMSGSESLPAGGYAQ